jgi:pantetheine-phosphate adenylyltransferase
LINRDNVSTTLAITKVKSQPSAEVYKNSAMITIESSSIEELKTKIVQSVYFQENQSIKAVPAKTGIVSGSFDPITNGHLWVIKNASEMVDKLYIVIASNSSKKPLFSLEERKTLVLNSLAEVDLTKNIEVVIQPENQLLVTTATALGAKYVFRGIRNFTDFEYENTLNFVNKKLNPDVETIFLIPPKELSDISSSTVKALMKYPQWKTISAGFICKTIEQALEKTAKDSI